eukprot:CAMPEP_0174229962 /NCGR_PEP_ID=MMETSP0417-20130205/805_1 /TAXON_ID=242541 /ORGANISM="Mayorella sp, Strain BSH-02190019" /LENGTH=569 /DNA_ID=CAMNT_0015307573 /DNA_START=100 /DNA_END=1809 /DNA_ORIENTATION=-
MTNNRLLLSVCVFAVLLVSLASVAESTPSAELSPEQAARLTYAAEHAAPLDHQASTSTSTSTAARWHDDDDEQEPVLSATDLASRAAASDDYGHSVHYLASEVVYPSSDQQVAQVVQRVRRDRQQLTVRGTGHSANGQSQCCGCVVMDMRNMNQVREATAEYVVVEAGAKFADVYAALAPFGSSLVTQTDWPGLSVGGVLSAGGGMGPGMFRHGFIAESILELTVVTGRSEIVVCSPSSEPELFNAAIGGLGQVGIITAIKLRAVPIPGQMIRVYHVYQLLDKLMPDYDKVQNDEAAGGAPFDQLQTFPVLNFPGTGAASGYAPDFFLFDQPIGSWVLIQEYGVFYNPGQEPDDAELFAYFDHVAGTEISTDMPYDAWIHRLDYVFGVLLPSAEYNYAWKNPHPWFEVLLPAETAGDYLTDFFARNDPSQAALYSVQALYPLKEPAVKRSLQPMPDSPSDRLVYLGMLRQVDIASTPDLYAENARLTALNGQYRLDAERVGGTPILSSTLPSSQDEWQCLSNFDMRTYRRAKAQFDPRGILSPGLSAVILNREDPCERNGDESIFRGTA